MKAKILMLTLMLAAGNAYATDGTCVFTYSKATRTIETKCDGINETLKKNSPEAKALMSGSAKECIVKKEGKKKERYCK